MLGNRAEIARINVDLLQSLRTVEQSGHCSGMRLGPNSRKDFFIMATTAAMLLDADHAKHLANAMPGRLTGRLVDIGEDRGVRITQKDDGVKTGFWEVVAVTSSISWVWWMPDQDIRTESAEGTVMATLGAPLHYPKEWARRVADEIDKVKNKRGGSWSIPQ